MNTFSAMGEDKWVVDILNGKRDGTFLDVGCWRPFEKNNTWLLERDYGWRGLSLDRDDGVAIEWVRSERKTPFICADIHLINVPALASLISPKFDYLSLDLDDCQLEFVEAFPWEKVRFGVMTVEHDGYRFGNERRDRIRSILESNGYQIGVRDVTCELGPFEDWWVNTQATI